MDGDVSKQFQRMLQKQGMDFKMGAKVTGVAKAKKGATVTFEPVAGGAAETIDADVVLVATGRKPYTEAVLALPKRVWCSTTAAALKWMAIGRHRSPASMPLAM